MEISSLIEDNRIKLIIFILGVLITLAALFGSIYGLAIGYNGIITKQPSLIVLGIATILALIGIFGAWCRFNKKLSSMSSVQRIRVRFFLFCGLAASIYLSSASLYAGFGWQISLFFLSFSLGIVAFLYATPKGF